MEPLGQFLREVREKRNLSIEKITEETHIVKKFIIAIENDDYTVFPGEAYLRGFLRNYSEFLDLEPEDVINRFDRIKLSETPTPIEKLIPKPSPNYKLIAFIVLLLVVVPLFGAGGFFGFKWTAAYIKKMRIAREINEANKSKSKIFSFETDEAVFDLKKNQQIEVKIGDKSYLLKVKELDPTVVILDPNDKEHFLIRAYSHKIDCDGDGDEDIEVFVNTWNDTDANIKFTRINSEAEKIFSQYNAYLTGEVETIYTSPQKIHLDFMLTILNDTLVRYKTDDNEEIEKYYKKDSVLKLSAKNQVLLWLANAGAVSLQFNGINKQLTPDTPGKVAVKLISVKKSEGKFMLQMSSLK